MAGLIAALPNVTSSSLSKIVSAETVDNDKKLNFELSTSYTPDPAILEGTGGFRFTKQIFQKSRIFNEMNMVNYHKRDPNFGIPHIWYDPIKLRGAYIQ